MKRKASQHNISLTATLSCGTPCTSSNCEHRINFSNKAKFVTVTEFEDDSAVELHTKHDVYIVPKHPSLNAYIGVCNGYKVRITLKKMVGTLSYWA